MQSRVIEMETHIPVNVSSQIISQSVFFLPFDLKSSISGSFFGCAPCKLPSYLPTTVELISMSQFHTFLP